MITLIIIAITVLTSIRAFSDQDLYRKFIFAPNYMSQTNEWHRFFTYGLLHGDWAHLIFNMYSFFLFGSIVENALNEVYSGYGNLIFIALYVSALPLSSLADYFQHKNNPRYLAVGASGAVSAVIFSSILIYPKMGIGIFPIPFHIPAYIFGPLYLAFCVYMARNSNDNIGHAAHFWGAIYGLIFTVIAIPGIVQHFISQVF